MKIPKILYGTGKEVHPRVTRFMAKVKKNKAWPEFGPEDFLDTDDFPKGPDGPKVMFELEITEGGKENFRVYAPCRYVKFSRPDTEYWLEKRMVFDGLVSSSWGLLCLLGTVAYVPAIDRDKERSLKFWNALVDNWELFLKERHLFYHQSYLPDVGPYFWNGLASQLWPCLVESGLPIEVLRAKPVATFSDHQVPEWIEEYILGPGLD